MDASKFLLDLMDASKLLLATKDRMKLRELAFIWAQELGVSSPELELRLLWACNSGLFGTDFLVFDTYFLRRDEVLRFARLHGLEPPSCWKDSDSEKAQAKDSFSAYKEAILAFLSSGPKCKDDVRSHGQKTVGRSRKLFDEAWRETPENLKVERGKKPPIKPS
jgi:hypothetical protein